LCVAVNAAIHRDMENRVKYLMTRLTEEEHDYYSRKLHEEKAKGKKVTFTEVCRSALRKRWGSPKPKIKE
jgi:hypothetical protein